MHRWGAAPEKAEKQAQKYPSDLKPNRRGWGSGNGTGYFRIPHMGRQKETDQNTPAQQFYLAPPPELGTTGALFSPSKTVPLKRRAKTAPQTAGMHGTCAAVC